MATPIKRIEKDFMLKVLYDEQIPMTLRSSRSEFIALVEEPVKKQIRLTTDKITSGLKKNSRLELMFDYRSQTISFSLEVKELKERTIIADAPEFLYKNLTRDFARIHSPDDLKVTFTYKGDRFRLNFPKTTEFESLEGVEYSDNFNPNNIRDLINQLDIWAREAASGHKLVMFKDLKPTTMEERLLADTGKVLFIPSTQTDLMDSDPYPKKRLITGEAFKEFLEREGTDPFYVDDQLRRFLKAKLETGIFSDVWVPILFQEYVVGYIHLWIDAPGKPPFDLGIVDTLCQFARVLAFSLKINGYFKDSIVRKEMYLGKVIDISISGLLFCNGQIELSATLLPDSKIEVSLATSKRTVKTIAKIVRRYRDGSQYYYGCQYTTIAPEDRRFLFEYLYGKPMTDADASFLSDPETTGT